MPMITNTQTAQAAPAPTDLERFQALQVEAAQCWAHIHDQDNFQAQLAALVFMDSLIAKNTLCTSGVVHISVHCLRNELIDCAARALGLAIFYHDMYKTYLPMEEIARNTFKAKNRDYADSYKAFGSCGVVIRLGDKLRRVQRLTRHKAAVASESLVDTLLDLYNYCLMAVLLIDQGL